MICFQAFWKLYPGWLPIVYADCSLTCASQKLGRPVTGRNCATCDLNALNGGSCLKRKCRGNIVRQKTRSLSWPCTWELCCVIFANSSRRTFAVPSSGQHCLCVSFVHTLYIRRQFTFDGFEQCELGAVTAAHCYIFVLLFWKQCGQNKSHFLKLLNKCTCLRDFWVVFAFFFFSVFQLCLAACLNTQEAYGYSNFWKPSTFN